MSHLTANDKLLRPAYIVSYYIKLFSVNILKQRGILMTLTKINIVDGTSRI
jgi:hypothetical protein